MATQDKIAVIYVPSDVGSMIKGKHLAPAAFQSIGFAQKLKAAGYNQVHEINALPKGPQVWSVDAAYTPNGVRNETANVQVNHNVKQAVITALQTDKKPSSQQPPFLAIVGGECNMVPAIMSGLWSAFAPARIGLLYIDADADLTIPGEASSSGNLASMTFTHLTMRAGALESMREFTRPDGGGVCDPSNTVIYGLNINNEGNTRSQLAYLFDEGYRVFTNKSIAGDRDSSAHAALDWLQQRVDHIFVHLDVDAIDATTFPLANVPQRTGLGFEKIMLDVQVFLSAPKVVGISIGEVNPDHDPGLVMTRSLVDRLTSALKERLRR